MEYSYIDDRRSRQIQPIGRHRLAANESQEFQVSCTCIQELPWRCSIEKLSQSLVCLPTKDWVGDRALKLAKWHGLRESPQRHRSSRSDDAHQSVTAKGDKTRTLPKRPRDQRSIKVFLQSENGKRSTGSQPTQRRPPDAGMALPRRARAPKLPQPPQTITHMRYACIYRISPPETRWLGQIAGVAYRIARRLDQETVVFVGDLSLFAKVADLFPISFELSSARGWNLSFQVPHKELLEILVVSLKRICSIVARHCRSGRKHLTASQCMMHASVNFCSKRTDCNTALHLPCVRETTRVLAVFNTRDAARTR